MADNSSVLHYLEQLAPSIPGPIYWKDRNGKYLGANQILLKITSLKSLSDIVGKTDCDLWPQTAAQITANDRQVITSGKPLHTEEKIILSNGKIKYFMVIKTPLKSENGDIIGVIGNSIDITQSKEQELERIEQENMVYQLLEKNLSCIPSAFYWKDKNHRFLGANKAALDYVGFKYVSEIIGKTDYDLWPKELAEKYIEDDNYVIQTGQMVRKEDMCPDLKGHIKYCYVVKVPLYDDKGEIIGVIGNSIDITENMESERLARENNLYQLFEKNFSCIPSSIYWKDKEHRFLGANKAALEYVGLKSVSEIVGKTDYDIWPKELAEKFIEDDNYVIKTGETIQMADMYTDMSGRTKYCHAIKAPLYDDNGEIIGIIGSTIDVTDNKELEQLAQQNQIYQVKTEEQEKFRKVVGQMVHDIQSPLSSLNSMLKEDSSKFPETKRNILRTAVTSITDITNHMLRSYSNKPNAEDEQKQPVLVSEVLLQIASEKRHEYKDRSINFQTRFLEYAKDIEFSFIKIEPIAFRRMLSNLINNAVDALKDKLDGQVELRLDADDEKVTLAIADNGKGMPKELIDKIMENIDFSEGKENGHGLGLMQVRDTLTQNDASLRIRSHPGSGTTMVIKFPRVPMPTWIVDEIKIIKDDLIIVLDDDESIHYAWDNKFRSIIEKVPEIQVKHFSDGIEVIDFINNLSVEERVKTYLLTDLELLEQKVSGIDVIKQTGVERSLLVTSHYANSKVRDLAINNHVKLLPKNLAFAVKIKIDKRLKPASRKVDMVWLDDERDMVEKFIKMQYKHLKVDIYDDPINFLEDVHQYPLDTKIILDHYLYSFGVDCELNGIKIAEILHDKSYTNLLLITGTIPESVPEYLKVILKSEKDKLFSLMETR